MEQSTPHFENCLGRMGHRDFPSAVSHEFYQRTEEVSDSVVMGDRSDRNCSSPATLPVVQSGKNVTSNQSSSQNGYGPASTSNGNDVRSSTTPNRSQSRSQKPHKHLSQETRPSLSRAERMAALERRMVANGLSPGRGRPRHRRLRQTGSNHMGVVQINDSSPTTASESSESEMENSRVKSGSPVMFGNPMEAQSPSPLPRNKFSFGSLQLDEEADEDTCQVLSDDEVGQIFSC